MVPKGHKSRKPWSLDVGRGAHGHRAAQLDRRSTVVTSHPSQVPSMGQTQV